MIDDIEEEAFALMVEFKRESPFPESKFSSEMVDMGYDMSEEVQIEAKRMPDEKSIHGDIYEKGSLGVSYMSDPGLLAISIEIQELENVESAIEDIINMLSEELRVDIDNDISQFQTTFQGNIWEGESTLKYFAGKYEPDISEIFDEECDSFSFRLISGVDSTELPQYDIRIEPYARNTDYFYVKIIASYDNLEESLSLPRA